jgi:hypothetical protein
MCRSLPLIWLITLASCGGGTSDVPTPSAEELSLATGKTALVGRFEISNFSVSPNPTTVNWVVTGRYDARFTGQMFPKRSSFLTAYVAVRDDQSALSPSTIEFQLVSGVPGNGTYEAKGAAGLTGTGSATGPHSFGTRIDPVANGYAFAGTDAAASVIVTVEPLK